ncbi:MULTISPECIES: enhanced intracellular survival protein Eis [Corallococcus]|uniref:GNAT family N-acetyltransferase n=1 Tax=Corallococcus TaxID=83461 RepID=UPI00117CC8E8|nr:MULTISPECIES: GNAT family N-acetyltransferase [Corallococcus]NBD11466.1 GNAT family N-acetyltransferase [Corallococcus silvisoli]TSC32335.1 GNAT family N-acetyltransferase [Corallococcus sp. Z5C101001]
MASAEYGLPRDEQELAAIADITAQAFAMSATDAETVVLKNSAESSLRILRVNGEVAATLTLIRMGQFLGGRGVPLIGVGGVGVAPAHRGAGAATRLFRHFLREMRDAGSPLSVLYPATQPLYRRVGYELAGARYEIHVDAASLELGERSLSLRPSRLSDDAAVEACYRRFAAQHHGWLDRGDYIWRRVRTPRNDTAHGFVVEGDSGVEGYVYLVRQLAPQGAVPKQVLKLTDLTATTPAAARRLLRFLGDHRSLAQDVVWFGGADEPLLTLLREQTYQVKLSMHWMARLLDVPRALEARGFVPGLSGALHLDVEDDLFPENQGRFVLEVEGGTARVRPGGEGRMRLHARALAPLYTGFLTPRALQLAGMLSADDASLDAASALFAGPSPSMRDMF